MSNEGALIALTKIVELVADWDEFGVYPEASIEVHAVLDGKSVKDAMRLSEVTA